MKHDDNMFEYFMDDFERENTYLNFKSPYVDMEYNANRNFKRSTAAVSRHDTVFRRNKSIGDDIKELNFKMKKFNE